MSMLEHKMTFYDDSVHKSVYQDTTTSGTVPVHSTMQHSQFTFDARTTASQSSWFKSWSMVVLGTQATLGLLLTLTALLLAINGDCIYLFGHLVLANLVFTTAGLLFWGYTSRRYEVLLYSMAAMVTGGSVYLFVSVIIMMWLIVVASQGYGQVGWLPAGCWMFVSVIQLLLALPIRQAMIACRREHKASLNGNNSHTTDNQSLVTNSTNQQFNQSVLQSEQQPMSMSMPAATHVKSASDYMVHTNQAHPVHHYTPTAMPPAAIHQQQPLLNSNSIQTDL